MDNLALQRQYLRGSSVVKGADQKHRCLNLHDRDTEIVIRSVLRPALQQFRRKACRQEDPRNMAVRGELEATSIRVISNLLKFTKHLSPEIPSSPQI